MIANIDHIVILVTDLSSAVADYSELGFTVTPGGEHTGGETHNALVAFADGTYLELIAFKRNAPEHRWWHFAATGEGLIDFALLPTEIAADIATIRERGLFMQGPFAGGRRRPDGQEIRWQTGTPTTSDLPFLCADVTPRHLRVPGGPAQQHPNGVSGISRLAIAVSDLAASAARYQALLGVEPQKTGASKLDFPFGQTTIQLIETRHAPEVQSYVKSRGEGPYSMTLRGATHKFDPALTHGVGLN